MKNIYKSAIILSVSLAAVGCNGFLDRYPYDEVSSKAVYSSATLAENAVVEPTAIFSPATFLPTA